MSGLFPMKKYLVIHTPGTFGSFLAWLIDSYTGKALGESPFLPSGNSHGRKGNTVSWDIVLPQLKQKYEQKDTDGANIIGIHWEQKWFPYLLHAGIDRTNEGQYGESGVEYAEKNFYEFMEKHMARLADGSVWMKSYKQRLLEHFNFDCNAENPVVPRLVLRNLFWLNLASEKTHISTQVNEMIKSSTHAKIDIETILDYELLKRYLDDMFGYDLDFNTIHKQFIEKNNSLREFKLMRQIVEAVKNGEEMGIPKMSVIGECVVMYELERHFFNINFYNLPFYFKNTKDVFEYVRHYPNYMKNPNKFYQTHWRDFKNE